MKPIRMRNLAQPAALAVGLSLCGAVQASQVFGTLANFDSVNDTGTTAHGFEIELEGIRRSNVLDVFGMNRNFGTASPGDVVRYGVPTIQDLYDSRGAVSGVRIVYSASYSAGVWSAGTASGVFNTPGESCWTFGNVGYPNVPCDHFGVSTDLTPTRTTYNWLLETATPGVLAKAGVAIPSVSFSPPAAPAAPVVAVIQAQQPDPVKRENNAFWVKIITTTLPDAADLSELMGGNNAFANPRIAAMNGVAETEIEWQVLQPGMVDEVSKAVHANGDPSVVLRYEFFRYLGTFDDDGYVDPKPFEFPSGNQLTAYVGNYVGEQIAAFAPVQQRQAVSEPATLAVALGGLLGLAWARRGGGRSGARRGA